MHRYIALLSTIAILSLVACAKGEKTDEPEVEATATSSVVETLTVYTVSYPLQYFAQRIGGDRVDARFPAPADVDPAYWAPAAETIGEYQQADLILLNGAGYAKWMERATLPASKLVDTSVGYQDRLLQLKEGTVHTHGLEGEHSHKGYAFTTWLDPTLAVEQARAVAAALTKASPEERDTFQSGLESLIADLEALDERQAELTLVIGDQALVFSHPVYQYLIDRYQLNALSVHWEPDEVPSADQWQELEELLGSHPARWMIWEARPAPETVQRLQELGIESVVYAPCGNTPTSGDLLAVMQSNADALAQIQE